MIFQPLEMLFAEPLIIFISISSGLLIGLILGALPGVSPTMALSVVLAPSLLMKPLPGIIFLSSVYTSGVYGGGITSILMNIPGGPASVATCFDGYPMTVKGEYSLAIGYSLAASLLGAFIGYFVLSLILVPMGKIVIHFGPSEMAIIMLFAFSIIGSIHGDLTKGLLSGFLGLVIGSIGINPVGIPRGTFGIYQLLDGVNQTAAIVGMFAISEALFLLSKKQILQDNKKNIKKLNLILLIQAMRDVLKKFKMLVLRSSLIGVFIGILPAAGSTIASIISYSTARNNSKEPWMFGKGSPEGVISAETANNASEGGAMATMLVLAIPGGTATAVLMGAFMMHGLLPGPYLIRNNLDFAYAIIYSNFLQIILLMPIAIIVLSFLSKIVTVSTKYLAPAILFFVFMGSVSLRASYFDVIIAFLMGILGFAMRKFDYPFMAFALGLLLSGQTERNFYRAYVLFHGNFLSLFNRPIVLILIVLTLISVYFGLKASKKLRL